MKSQIETSSFEWGGRRVPPLAYTEYGALQAASVLKTELALKMSVFIIRAFVRLREMILVHEDLSEKVTQLEKRVSGHDQVLVKLITEIRTLIEAPKPNRKKNRIGYILPNSGQ
jgi:hypothetical protein